MLQWQLKTLWLKSWRYVFESMSSNHHATACRTETLLLRLWTDGRGTANCMSTWDTVFESTPAENPPHQTDNGRHPCYVSDSMLSNHQKRQQEAQFLRLWLCRPSNQSTWSLRYTVSDQIHLPLAASYSAGSVHRMNIHGLIPATLNTSKGTGDRGQRDQGSAGGNTTTTTNNNKNKNN